MEDVVNNVPTRDIQLELRQAAAKGDLLFIQNVCKENKQIDINAAGLSGKTALHQAVIFNHLDVVEYLLSLPGIRNTKDKIQKTAYNYAADNFDIVRLLCRKFQIGLPAPKTDLACTLGVGFFLQLTQNISQYSEKEIVFFSQSQMKPGSFYMGYSLLFLVVLHSADLTGVEALIKAGENPDTQACSYQPLGFRNTPLHSILACENSNEYIKKYLDIVERCGKKLNFAIQDDQGKTTLLLAAKIRRPAMVQELLNRGALDAIHIADKEERNILHIACALGDYDTHNILKNTTEYTTLMAQKDKQGRLPSDMLNLPEIEISKLLKSIYIEPERDLNAPLNDSSPDMFIPARKSLLEACIEGRQLIKETLIHHSQFRM